MVGAEAMRRLWLIVVLVLAGGAADLSAPAAQPQPVPGLIAQRETELLSYEDKLAAYDAEQAVLAQDGMVRGYNWRGPDGAYGTIIAGGALAQDGGRRHCRRFIHIVHHPNDGGANPTFQGVACRDQGGLWMAR